MTVKETILKGTDPKAPLSSTFKIHSRDPWARREAWRKDPFFSRANTLRGIAPGLGIATVAFTIYCAVEYMVSPKDNHH